MKKTFLNLFGLIKPKDWVLLHSIEQKHSKVWDGYKLEGTSDTTNVLLYYSNSREKYKIDMSYYVHDYKKGNAWLEMESFVQYLNDMFVVDLLRDIELNKILIPHIIRKTEQLGLVYNEVFRITDDKICFVIGKTQEDIDNYETDR